MASTPLNETLAANTTDTTPPGLSAADLDRASINQFQYYAWGVAGNIIPIFGLLGNALSLVVLCHRRLHTSTSVFLIALAVYDSLVLISLVLFMALPVLRFRAYMDLFPYLQPYGYPFALTAQTCSIYTTVGFTVERYIAVCHPLKAATYCTISRVQKSALIILLASVVYNIPRMLEYKTEVLANSTYVTYSLTEFGRSDTYRHIYFIYMHIFFMLLVPFLTLLLLNIALVRAVRRSGRATGKQLTSKQRTENNLTVMLISVVAVFLVCQVPSIFDNIFMVTLEQEVLDSAPFVKLTCVSSLMVITNSATNFYLYCVFGKRFREVFCSIFCLRCAGDSRRRRLLDGSMLGSGSCKRKASSHDHIGLQKRASPNCQRGETQNGRHNHHHRNSHYKIVATDADATSCVDTTSTY